jgi:cytochrome b involved in lipid metabolism
MKRFMFGAFIAFWASVISIWSFATLASGTAGQADPASEAASERTISAAELAAHGSAADCWMAIDGVVYDFSAYIPEHPAPPVIMTQWCGREATEAYHTKGYGRPHSPAADALLPPYRVGVLLTPDDSTDAE